MRAMCAILSPDKYELGTNDPWAMSTCLAAKL